MKILVTGACGYKGSVLVPKLLDAGHEVTALDTQWFGDNLPRQEHLTVLVEDLRNAVGTARRWLPGHEAVIHLAAIANDPCGELDAKLTWEVNALATMRLADACARAGVGQFVFASSASIYGLKNDVPCTEEVEPEPVSDYNKTKMVAERAILSYADRMVVQIVRPATVCGISPRMRLDTMVNMLTYQALSGRKITAHCGEHGAGLMRPNVHIEDITDLYVWLLGRPDLRGCFNAGFENLSAMDTAKLIQEQAPAEIEITKVRDKRSYAVDSAAIRAAGFSPKRTVSNAIESIVAAYGAGKLRSDERSINLVWMRKLGIAA